MAAYVLQFVITDGHSTAANELHWEVRTAASGGGSLLAHDTATSGVTVTTGPIDDPTLVTGSNTRWLYVTDGAANVHEQQFTVTALFEQDVDLDGLAAIDAEGDVTITADIPPSGDAVIDAEGDISIAPAFSGDAAIGATGNLDVLIIITVDPSGEAEIDAEGSLTIVSVSVLGGEAVVDADGTIQITADVPVSGDAAIDATGDVVISPDISGDAAITAEGEASIAPDISGDAAVDAAGDVEIEAEIPPSGDAAIDATGAAQIEAEVPLSGEAAIAATGSLDIELAGFEIRGHRLRAEFDDAQGNPIGAGPVVDIVNASYSLHLDEVGTFSLEIPAAHPVAGQIISGTRMRLYREGEGLIFQGIVHTPRIVVPESGENTLQVEGDSVARELVWHNTLFGREFRNTAMPAAINTLVSGTGWTAATATDPRSLTAQFEAASIWKALAHSAEMFGWHVRENNLTRTVDVGPLGGETGLILQNVSHVEQDMAVVPIRSLSLASVQADLWNRVIPVGGGDGINVLTLRYSNRSSPHTIQSATGPDGQPYWYIQDTASISAHGLRIMPLSFPDIVPLSNSPAEIRNAANALYDIASAWLSWHAQPHETYEVEIAGIKHYDDGTPLIRVGDKVRLVYRGLALDKDGQTVVWKDIDADLYILEMERSFSPDGLNDWSLTVSTSSRETLDGAAEIAQAIDDLWAVKTSKRPYSYQDTHGPFVESVESGSNARFLVRFDGNITYLHRAMLTVRKRRVKSNVKGASGGPEATALPNAPQNTDGGGAHGHSVNPGTPPPGGAHQAGPGGAHGHSVNPGTPPPGGGHQASQGTSHTHTVTGGTAEGSGLHWHQVGSMTNPTPYSTPSHRQQLILHTGPLTGPNYGVWVNRDSASPGSGIFTTTQTSDHVHPISGITNQPEFTHRHDVQPHQHTISGLSTNNLSSHQHGVQPHQHTISGLSTNNLSAHNHPIQPHTHPIEAHEHPLEYGIFLGPTATAPQFRVLVNGVDRTSALGGPWNNDFEVDVTQFLVDGQGHVLRQNNNIDIQSNQLADVEVTVRAFVTAHSVTPV